MSLPSIASKYIPSNPHSFIISAVCFASMARTGYLGGQIRHTEISNPANTGTQADKEQEKEANGDKDDD